MTPLNRKTITYEQLAKTIDHSILYPDQTEADVIAELELAKRYNVASVAVKPCHVTLAATLLQGSGVAVGTTIGFPHGANTTATKVFEAQDAMANGAVELDMVINVGALRSGHADDVREDIRRVVETARAGGSGVLVKVILEIAYLSDEEKVLACKLVEEAGADFVKNSTGYAPSGYTLPDLKLMRAAVGPNVQVKASAGVRTLDAALDVIDVGCTRIGTIATAVILDEFKKRH
ncbi:MAG: deoxyribose-phosphate aldolase, partial [Chloroflexi bacterium]|nr:deoxyribose-phosphate aldolase [Chloroflexota bacterium]